MLIKIERVYINSWNRVAVNHKVEGSSPPSSVSNKKIEKVYESII